MMLKSVVLPAPFGPMSAWISPARTSSVASLTARMPPKDFDTPSACRTTPCAGCGRRESGSGSPS